MQDSERLTANEQDGHGEYPPVSTGPEFVFSYFSRSGPRGRIPTGSTSRHVNKSRQTSLCVRFRQECRGSLTPVPFILRIPPPVSGATVATSTCAYAGGWSLRIAALCPPTAPVSCGTGLQNRCCPSGFECVGSGVYQGNYCCLSGKNCQPQASQTPQVSTGASPCQVHYSPERN